jgi:hypothetical protein
MFYKALGYMVWKSAKFYAGQKLPARKLLAGGAVALGVAALVAAGASRNDSE